MVQTEIQAQQERKEALEQPEQMDLREYKV
jgi:hypothetical protein